jgi:cell division protein FtsB
MSLRRRKGGGGQGHEPQAAPRVRGAWTTPAVVVRAPDGSVVGRTTRPTRGPSGRAPARRRVPPPGATGGVLAVPTRAMVGDPASSRSPSKSRSKASSRSSSKSPSRSPSKSPSKSPSRPKAGSSADRPRGSGARTKGNRRLVPSLRLDKLAPNDEEARERRNARLRWLGTRVGSVALAGLLVYAVFPVRTFLSQRSDNNRAREQLDVLSEENERLEQRADDLRDPETVEEIARRDHNLVMPGEESYAILPPPEATPDGDSTSEP